MLIAAFSQCAGQNIAYVNTGVYPTGVAVNPVTDTVYIANQGPFDPQKNTLQCEKTSTVTALDGASNLTWTIPVGFCPDTPAVNTATNRIYVANSLGDDLMVLDGATSTLLADIQLGDGTGTPSAVAVNPVTNMVYVADTDAVVVVDGATNTVTADISTYDNPQQVIVDPVRNRIYVLCFGTVLYGQSGVIEIDGATSQKTYLQTEEEPMGMALNPVTNMLYISAVGGAGQQESIEILDGSNFNNYTVQYIGRAGVTQVVTNPVTGLVYMIVNAGIDVVNWPNPAATPQIHTFSLPVDGSAEQLAVDPAVNKIYIAGYLTGTGLVMDGLTNAITSLDFATPESGPNEFGIAVNPATHKAYITSATDNVVGVVNTTVPSHVNVGVGGLPSGILVDPAAHRVYTGNIHPTGTNIYSLDTDTLAVRKTAIGTYAAYMALNPITSTAYFSNEFSSRIYAVSSTTNEVTPIVTVPFFGGVHTTVNPVTDAVYQVDAALSRVYAINVSQNNTVSYLSPTGKGADNVAVNPVTQRLYVTNNMEETVSVFNLVSGATIFKVPTGSGPRAIAVNPATDQVAVVNHSGHSVTVFDGATYASQNLAAGVYPCAVTYDPVNGNIFVANCASPYVTGIDGQTFREKTFPTGISQAFPDAIAVNPGTGRVYAGINAGYVQVIIEAGGISYLIPTDTGNNTNGVGVDVLTGTAYASNEYGFDITVVREETGATPVPLTTTIEPLANNTSPSATPQFTFQASSAFAPVVTTPYTVYYAVDSQRGAWSAAKAAGPGTFTGTTGPLLPGVHVLYAYAADGQDTGQAGTVLTGSIAAYQFLVAQQ